jgi:hypothetical protein
LALALKEKFDVCDLLYARLDVFPGLYISELELVEPELFFLDRRTMKPNVRALQLFHDGIVACCAKGK